MQGRPVWFEVLQANVVPHPTGSMGVEVWQRQSVSSGSRACRSIHWLNCHDNVPLHQQLSGCALVFECRFHGTQKLVDKASQQLALCIAKAFTSFKADSLFLLVFGCIWQSIQTSVANHICSPRPLQIQSLP